MLHYLKRSEIVFLKWKNGKLGKNDEKSSSGI